MLIQNKRKNRLLAEILSLAIIGVFLCAGLVYPESKLRVPLANSGDVKGDFSGQFHNTAMGQGDDETKPTDMMPVTDTQSRDHNLERQASTVRHALKNVITRINSLSNLISYTPEYKKLAEKDKSWERLLSQKKRLLGYYSRISGRKNAEKIVKITEIFTKFVQKFIMEFNEAMQKEAVSLDTKELNKVVIGAITASSEEVAFCSRLSKSNKPLSREDIGKACNILSLSYFSDTSTMEYGRLEQGFKFKITIDTERTPQIHPLELFGILDNFFANANARDAMKDMDTKEINISISMRDNIWRFEFSDTGKGIPMEKYAWVFTPGATGTQEKDRGMGLTLTKEIVEDAGGTVTIDSLTEEEKTEFERVMHVEDWKGIPYFEDAKKGLGEQNYRKLCLEVYQRFYNHTKELLDSLSELESIGDDDSQRELLESIVGQYNAFRNYLMGFKREFNDEIVKVLTVKKPAEIKDIGREIHNVIAKAINILERLNQYLKGIEGTRKVTFDDCKDTGIETKEGLLKILEWFRRQAYGLRTDRVGTTFIIEIGLQPVTSLQEILINPDRDDL